VRRLALILVTTLLAACTLRAHPPPSIPAAPADGALHVALSWAAPVDLDLYVTDPSGEALYFANSPTRAGGRLEQDARCADVAGGAAAIERATLPTPAPGTYRVGVDFIDACDSGLDAVPFRVAVERGGVRRDAEGTARRGEFTVVVLEFEVGEDTARPGPP